MTGNFEDFEVEILMEEVETRGIEKAVFVAVAVAL